jgi:hypothetical protein
MHPFELIFFRLISNPNRKTTFPDEQVRSVMKKEGVNIMGLESLTDKEVKFLKKVLEFHNLMWIAYTLMGLAFAIAMTAYFFSSNPRFGDAFIAGMMITGFITFRTYGKIIPIIKKLIGIEGIKSIELGNAKK